MVLVSCRSHTHDKSGAFNVSTVVDWLLLNPPPLPSKYLYQVMRRLMDAAGHGHVMTNDKKTREISLTQSGGWEEGGDASDGEGG